MKKIVMFFGSDRAFVERIPKAYRNLSDIAMQMDDENKQMQLVLVGLPGNENAPSKTKKPKIKVNNFVIFADEYSSVNEHVIINFLSFISKLSITNMYIQNPPIHLQEQIKRAFGDLNIIEEIPQKYNMVTEKTIRSINIEFDKRVIGQQAVKEQILKAIFPIMNNVQCKPIVLLFYGNSGIGKTETAQFLTEQIGGKILRKQFSMYQNNEFANYLFGGKYNEKSFAKDLIARDSNVILLDEFDKAYSVFHSAFYQLFDEGIYEDQLDSGYYERYMLSKDVLLPESVKRLGENPFLDSYVMEFLDLPNEYHENDLRKALIRNMKDFILELGKDFTFIDEEYKVQVGGDDFRIDLLFFHRGLQCLVAIELKIGKFKPEYVSKLDFYLEALDRQVKKENENPSVGLLLCATKNDEVVEYAMSRTMSPMLVSEYKLQLPDKKVLQKKLQELVNIPMIEE